MAAVEIPNLDGMTREEVETFAKRDEREIARTMFGSRPKSAQHAKTLRRYAESKAAAMRAREEGRIQDAIASESTCDHLYESLPEWAKW